MKLHFLILCICFSKKDANEISSKNICGCTSFRLSAADDNGKSRTAVRSIPRPGLYAKPLAPLTTPPIPNWLASPPLKKEQAGIGFRSCVEGRSVL